MFKMNDIKELIRAVDRSTIGELTIKGENDQQITISKQMNVGQVALIEETQVPATIAAAPVKVEAAPFKSRKKYKHQRQILRTHRFIKLLPQWWVHFMGLHHLILMPM